MKSVTAGSFQISTGQELRNGIPIHDLVEVRVKLLVDGDEQNHGIQMTIPVGSNQDSVLATTAVLVTQLVQSIIEIQNS